MPATTEQPERNAMEHAQLVMNAMARCETLMRPMFDARSAEERRELSRAMVAWLSDAPNSTLRTLLVDEPCPARFFYRWASMDQIKTWSFKSPEGCVGVGGSATGVVCVRPSEFFAALTASRPN